MRKEIAGYLAPGQFELQLIRQITALLKDIAINNGKADGWALMSFAGLQIRQKYPDEMSYIKELYGHKSLKSFILRLRFLILVKKKWTKVEFAFYID